MIDYLGRGITRLNFYNFQNSLNDKTSYSFYHNTIKITKARNRIHNFDGTL